VGRGEPSDALALLAKIPDTVETRRVAALARLALSGVSVSADAGNGGGEMALEQRLDALLDRVKADEQARQELVDLLETMDPSDPRRGQYRRALASRLF
jgi:putative thioredoxin